jgi:hypothetical protein
MYHIDELEDAVVVEDKTQTFIGKRPFYFPTNKPCMLIKNAVSGLDYKIKVGTFDSLKLFKVVDTTGVYDSAGVKLNRKSPNFPNKNPNHCYYDSPQQYMTHTRNRLNPELIELWRFRVSEIRRSESIDIM